MKTAVTALLAALAPVMADKQFVFVAGPRRSESTAVYQFFEQYATGGASQNGLDGWIWPQINETLPGEKYRYFENFFWNPNNATIQQILMQSIQDAWDSAEYGVIIGAEGFDNTRGSPDSIGLQTMHNILDTLNVPPQQVQVVIFYTFPRINQWVSLYHHNTDQDYESFVCKQDYSEHLANIPMNPLRLSSIYLEQGWKVATVDSFGANQMGFDVAHSVACQVLPGAKCEDGWIVNLGNQSITEEVIDIHEFTGLFRTKLNNLEGMFQSRDCFYKEVLEANEGFTVVHKSTIWETCGTTDAVREGYLRLTDDQHFFDLVKTQEGCATAPQQANHPIINDLPSGETTQKKGVNLSRSQQVPVIIGFSLAALFVLYQIIARFKRRQTHYVKSPRTGKDLWMDLAGGTFQANNLQSSSDEDAFSDVDLTSPRLNRSPQNNTPEPVTTMTDAAKEGRSVRGMYRVGVYRDSPSKPKPQKGDSELEFKIKCLESEFS